MISSRLANLLLLSTALAAPSFAYAQEAQTGNAAAEQTPSEPTDSAGVSSTNTEAQPAETPEVSLPGEIIVTGNRSRNIVKSSDQVISVLSNAEIARTGEGNISGALSRVTGLSVVGSGYVYVRGLGDRYSLAMLNGSPLPSPEPLRRVVPLDLFPSSLIASSLVQKSYSANFPGEFGGGVINLTTKAVPKEGFFNISGGIGMDTETTGQLGYTYYGSASDWTGFDNGQRDTPPALQAFFDSGQRMSSGDVDTTAIASQLINGRNSVTQKWEHLPPNFSLDLAGGKSFDVGDGSLGVIAAFGYKNKWLTRDATQQRSLNSDVSSLDSDFERVTTDNRIIVNGMLGLGYEFGENKIRWTNLYIRDTLKHTRIGLGQREGTDVDYSQQDTAWYERQLIDTQLVGEFKLAPTVHLDVRGTYANSQREAPYEISYEYVRTNSAADPYGNFFVNRLNNGNGGDADISFSDLNEDLWYGGADLTFNANPDITAALGYAYSDTNRDSSRRDFKFLAPSDFPTAIALLRPDYLLAPAVVDFYKIGMVETNEGNPAFNARLINHSVYGKGNIQISPEVSLDAGVRWETAKETVAPIQVFSDPGASTASTDLDRAYWLPSATLTWQMQPNMQVRASASKTIARPQFRELIYQFYFDPETNRMYQGNPLLVDSQLFNAEARYEWYFAPEQHFSVSAFYKKLDKPIEAFVAGADFVTSYANAPGATLWGAELEVQKYFDISPESGKGFFADRRLMAIANYTFSQSELSVSDSDTVAVYGAFSTKATDYFRDGAPLTGQSDHLVNLQFGLESKAKLSQQTLLLTYASKRAVSRGIANLNQPDVIEEPGLQLDFVAREGIPVAGHEVELKFEARNITGTKHQEYQQSGSNRIEINTYDVGTTLALTAGFKF